ncbi:hypothetical protein BDV12DRAFT_201825 [Aspergillus spectabilis]
MSMAVELISAPGGFSQPVLKSPVELAKGESWIPSPNNTAPTDAGFQASAGHLHYKSLYGWQKVLESRYNHVFSKIPVPGPELAELAAAIQRTGVSFCDTWIQELRNGSIDALVALLYPSFQT